ncbi:MAG: acetylornithine deacetylase [Thermomicrobiales bacterium]|nr:acetylornithine deacetylase [Thermomicrobiales bacterium]
MDPLMAAIDVAIDRRRDATLSLLADLVRIPSTLGNVRPAQERLLRHARQIGLDAALRDIDLEAVAAHPDFAPTTWSCAGQPNLTATLHGLGGGRSLVLNGHIDVVSAEPADWWSYDPWGATIAEGRMYGRGALDMKSGLVAALLAIRSVIDAGVALKGSVIFESVVEEECTGNGMLASRLRTGPVDGLVIMEPTNLQTWVATPGVVWFDVLVRGKPAYVGRAGESVNAVETAAAFIGRLKPRAVERLNTAFAHPAFSGQDRPLTLNVGIIGGGDWPSLVPLECRFTCRMSYPIDWSFAQARAFVESLVQEVAAEDPWLAITPPTVRFGGFRARGWEADTGGTLFRALDRCHVSAAGEPLGRVAFPGTADARYIDRAAGEQAVYYGPSGGNIHAPDEYVDIASIVTTARVLARMIVDWCGIAAGVDNGRGTTT